MSLYKSHICKKWYTGWNARILKSTTLLEQNDEIAQSFACWYKFMKIKSYLENFWAFHGQRWVWLFWLTVSKTGCISRMKWWNEAIFLHVDTNLRNLKNNPIVFGWVNEAKNGHGLSGLSWITRMNWWIVLVYIKNCIYYYLNDLINVNDSDFGKVVLDKKLLKIFLFIILDTKFQIVQNLCIFFYEIYGYIKGFERSK